jgi:hypothetical protein
MAMCAALLKPQARPDPYIITGHSANLLTVEGIPDWHGLRIAVAGLQTTNDLIPNGTEAELIHLAKGSLLLCILQSSYIDEWQPICAAVRAAGEHLVTLFPLDMTALAEGSWTMDELIEYKLYRSVVLDKRDVECQFEEALFNEWKSQGGSVDADWQDLTRTVEELRDEAHWVAHPRLDALVASLRENNDCLLVGPSSSGKSTLAFQAGRRLQRTGYRVFYNDIGAMPAAGAYHILTSLLNVAKSGGDTLLILDDLQGSPVLSKFTLDLIRLVKTSGMSAPPLILALSWPSYALEAAQLLSGARVTQITSGLVSDSLIARVPGLDTPEAHENLAVLAADDLVVLRLILDELGGSDQGSKKRLLPTLSRSALAERVWVQRIKGYKGDMAAAKRAVFVATVLGRYEFELPEGFLVYESSVTAQQINSLCAIHLLRRNGEKIVGGHRSLCTLMADWLARDADVMEQFAARHPTMQVADLVLSYIRSLDGSEIWPVLRTLYSQVGFRGHSATTQRAQVLTEFWKALDALVERIEHQTSFDPTWGNTLSSALFAIEALGGVGKRDRARKSIEFMRAHWRVEGGMFYVLGGTSERLDFDLIRERLEEEDAELGLGSVPGHQSAADLDIDRFHQTWVAGLVLCSEAAYGERSRAELDELARAVERLQSADGYFYPRRIPWVTGRVLIGLARCGRTIYNSPAVQQACQWLLTPSNEGGLFHEDEKGEGWWPSGSGKWNTPLETTTLCATSLVLAGMTPDNDRLAKAITYLKAHKADWVPKPHLMDGAMAIEAYVSLGGNWRDVTSELVLLFTEARREAFWGTATLSARDLFGQTCMVATIADYLVGTIWTSLRAELPDFLEAFAVPDLPMTRPLPVVVSSGSASSTAERKRQTPRPHPGRQDRKESRMGTQDASWRSRLWHWLMDQD